MYQPSVFCVKLQLHFGGDVHEISVPAFGGAEPTVTDLMTVVERDFRVPRALQNLTFHGQDLHVYVNEPLSRFGIKNGGTIRLVGRMAPADLIHQINAQHSAYAYQQPPYPYPQFNPMPTYQTVEQNPQFYSEQFHYGTNPSVATQYDPPLTPQNKAPSPATPQHQTPLPATPQNRTPLPATPQNKTSLPPTPQNRTPLPPTPNQGQPPERTNSQAATPKPSN